MTCTFSIFLLIFIFLQCTYESVEAVSQLIWLNCKSWTKCVVKDTNHWFRHWCFIQIKGWMKYIWNNIFVLVLHLSGYWNDPSIWQLNCISFFPKGSQWNILHNWNQEEHLELLNLLWFPFHFLVLLMSKQICKWCQNCYVSPVFLSQTNNILDFFLRFYFYCVLMWLALMK